MSARTADVLAPAARYPGLLGMAARAALVALLCAVIVGPLASLVVWSVAERWHWPALVPQAVGLKYWARITRGDLLGALVRGVSIAVITTTLALLTAIPISYGAARRRLPLGPVVLMLFLLPQAFPQLPVFASAAVLFYRWNLAGTIPGVVLIHLVGGLVYAVWTMTAVFRSIGEDLEEAAINLGASMTHTFFRIALPLAAPGIVASAILVFIYSLDEFTGTLLVGAPYVTTLPVYMYTASLGYELQIASVTALVLMAPGVVLLVLMERFLRAEYLAFFGRL
ncbi:MAG: ABC transporter permease subunit [Armatimonadota bacterium]|nr:ABC transporter permease subunit [Armatimonadota bacterium]MDR7486051.1 ABC transporter permease subunit [Armatimonadota bacterium]MDR7532623.1 ABC transporter permease subunit [Armatimonadota bacterium]MDR7536169.1 ABC transporter permease subunit [Armatimonadota bacterium]